MVKHKDSLVLETFEVNFWNTLVDCLVLVVLQIKILILFVVLSVVTYLVITI